MERRICLFGARALLLGLCAAAPAARAQVVPVEPVPNEAILRDFRFSSGETLAELKINYVTYGRRLDDGRGKTANAVLVLHGTGGSSAQFLGPTFAGVLFGPGQPLDASRYYIVIPDGIGHGGSSKPSDGLRAKFPRYTYDDMVRAQHRLLTESLGVTHLRLVIGTSMGGMHAWVWGETHPDFMDALLPLASLPAPIAGRNRMWRKMAMDLIRGDPAWKGGDYTEQPPGLRGALSLLLTLSGSPLGWMQQAPDRAAADAAVGKYMSERLAKTDANDLLFALDASRDYDPWLGLEKIRAPLLAINFADDAINPPELGILEKGIARVKNGQAVVFPLSEKTRGHQTHTLADVWKTYLNELLVRSRP
ncbi:MAG TPA: alpha/beta fold hydrolase [Thermoanaerobaculia bacterium]|nr:alpha/beta fold hydrolase [Thermoanaerobaculia bacterium]